MPLMRSVPSVWAKLSNVRSHFAIRLMESFSSGSAAGIKRNKFCSAGPLDLLKKISLLALFLHLLSGRLLALLRRIFFLWLKKNKKE